MRKLTIAALAGVVLSVCSLAMAAEPAKIAVANPAKIFQNMQELKDLRAKMDSERRLLEGVDKEMNEKVNRLKDARDALKVNTPQYQDKHAEWLKAFIEYQTWGRINQENFQRDQKIQMKVLYEKIEQAVGDVGKQKGYDLVLVDQRPELPDDIDRINLDQLRAIINQRTVLYSSDKVDISNDVLALLDSRYRSTAAPATTKP